MFLRPFPSVWFLSLLWLHSLSTGNAAAPIAPASLKATAIAYNYVGLSWVDSSTDEVGFEIEDQTTAGFVLFSNAVPANATTRVLTGSTPGTTFTFRVRAYNLAADNTTRVYSAWTLSPAVTTPAATAKFDSPTNLTGTKTDTAFSLTWMDNATVETYYDVYYRDPLSSYSLLGSFTGNGTGPIEGLDFLANYKFLVVAVKEVPAATLGKPVDKFTSASPHPTIIADYITSKAGASGVPGAALSHTFTNTTNSAVTSRTLTNVPDNLTFNSVAGTLTGTFPALGVSALTQTVSFANGWMQVQTFYLRVRSPQGPPVPASAIPNWTAAVGTTRDTPLTGTFVDAEEESAVRINTTKGNVDVVLFNQATPGTVANFMNYVNSGKYADVILHRAPQNFVVQGGAFRGSGTGNQFTAVPTDPPATNEPGIPNLRGTVSLARRGGYPNSGTNQFFFNLGDNRANLDFQNGGFTVFGRVAGNGMSVVDAINALPKANYAVAITGSTQTSFDSFPVDAAVAPATVDQTKMVKMNSATPIPTLRYTITGNTHPEVATASLVNGQLHLVGLAGGQTNLTLTATDLDDLTAMQTFSVQLTDTYATWAARTTFPSNQSASGQNADGDTLNNFLEYAFLANPSLPDASAAPVLGKTSANEMTLTLQIRKFTSALTYTVQASPTITGPWTPLWSSPQGYAHPLVLSTADLPDRTLVTIKDTEPIAATGRRFLCVKVSE